MFRVRAKIGNSNSKNTVSYAFSIRKPWYATHIALAVYTLLWVLLAHYIHRAYKEFYRKQEPTLIEENNLLLEIKELES